jgi:hypothetical protein
MITPNPNVSRDSQEPGPTGDATSEMDGLLRLILAPRTNRLEIGIRLQLVAHPTN